VEVGHFRYASSHDARFRKATPRLLRIPTLRVHLARIEVQEGATLVDGKLLTPSAPRPHTSCALRKIRDARRSDPSRGELLVVSFARMCFYHTPSVYDCPLSRGEFPRAVCSVSPHDALFRKGHTPSAYDCHPL
jgi:hypothetical protein